MSDINQQYIEEYIRNILPQSSNCFQKLENYAKDNHVPIIHPEVAQFLKVLLGIKKPKKILELGTAIGYSALVMAECLNKDVQIYSIERRLDMVEIAQKNIKKFECEDKIHVIYGEAQDILPTLKEKYDFIFLDAAKGHYLQFFKQCINKLNCSGIIVSDNVLYKGMVANDDLVIRRKKTIVKRMRQYLKYILSLKEFESCVLPLGDGVALSYKKEGK